MRQQGSRGPDPRTRAGEGGEVAKLACPERKARSVGVMACVAIGESGDRECGGMGRHMPAVGKKGHRAEHYATNDLLDHHGARHADNQPAAPFVSGVANREKNVLRQSSDPENGSACRLPNVSKEA